jgi:uncharacterized metal-binding protein YceD (DUF177 family)
MKVALRKVTKTPLDFEVSSDKITLKGYLEYDSGKLILLKANLNGLVNTECSLCGEEMNVPVDEQIELFISDGIYEANDDIALDVVESFDSMADLDEILNSEIELIKSDYFSCEKCKAD